MISPIVRSIIRLLSFKKSRFWLSIVPYFRSRKHEFSWLQAEFRVEKVGLPRLADALRIPAVFHCKQRSICDGLCVLLRRTSYPYADSAIWFNVFQDQFVLCLITNEVMDFIYDNHCHLVKEWNRDVLSWVALQQYAETIAGKGSPLNNCFGFIDGTVRPISRPGNGQRIAYNGHKRD